MLLGNYSTLNRNADTMGAKSFTNPLGEFKATAFHRWYQGEQNVSGQTNKSGWNYGYRVTDLGGYAWHLPPVAGAIGVPGTGAGTGALVVGVAGGKNAAAALDGTGSLSATGQLVVSAAATIGGTGSLTAAMIATLNGSATLTGAGSLSSGIDALGHAVATLTGTGSLSAVRYGTGEVAATITIGAADELSPAAIASAVWEEVLAGHNTAGSAGAALTFLHALGHNKVVTDPSSGTFTVYDVDDVTPLYTADLWENAAGTLPYDGNGSERRDQFA